MSEQVLTVSELTAGIRGLLEESFDRVWVEGEISNYRLPGSGHHYFTLKDRGAQLACVFFKGSALRNRTPLEDGLQVQACGRISVYDARGQYQLIVQAVQPRGFGDLQAKFEALKRKLDAEGLFDPARKRPLPAFPRVIGVVTSPTGAAIRDMIHVLGRRAPWVRVLVRPVRVQGEGAAGEIAAAVNAFGSDPDLPRPDLVIVARGGGSIEDLWAFNEEVVARAIAACPVPVLSGVGHEIDFTIADFAADARAPTPSAAAESAAPDGAALRRQLGSLSDALDSRCAAGLNALRRRTESLGRELHAREPARRVQGWMQGLDYLGERLDAAAAARCAALRAAVDGAGRSLASVQPERSVLLGRERAAQIARRLEQAGDSALREPRRRLEALAALLHSLGPDSVLRRGFSLTTDGEGNLITDAAQVQPGQRLLTRLARGSVASVAERGGEG